MAETSTIEWTDATWNPVTGCSIKSPGCRVCYAMILAGTRLQHHPSRAGLTKRVNGKIVWTGEVRFNEAWLTQPLHWRRPRMVFVCAHGDLFHEDVPDAWIDQVFAVMALATQHTFQVLTKRSDRMRDYAARWFERLAANDVFLDHPAGRAKFADLVDWAIMPTILPNVWLGVSAERQPEADERIPDLLATPAAVRFVSLEPLLGPIDLREITKGEGTLDALDPDTWEGLFEREWKGTTPSLDEDRASMLDWYERSEMGSGPLHPPLDWIIVGGESGDGATPMQPAWARSLRDQCAAAGKLDRFFFKQWGEWGRVYGPMVEGDIMIDGQELWRAVGKTKAGRLLDGIEHNGMPPPG